MTQLAVLQKIKELVRQRYRVIEQEKLEHPQDISTLRLMDSDLGAILDSVEDAISSWQDLPGLSYNEAQEQAMSVDSSDGPVADHVEGYRILPGEEV